MIILDHSARQVWDTCRRKYFWNYVLQLEAGRSDPMAEGAAVHEGLYHWYKTKDLGLAQTHVVVERPDGMLPQEEDRYRALDAAMRELLRGYTTDPEIQRSDAELEVLDGEICLAWEIAPGYWYCGIADGLVRNRVLGLLTHEFKRTSQIPADWVARLQIDAQTTGYVMLFRKSGVDVKGAMLSILRATKYPEYVREAVITPEWLLAELEAELRNIVGELEERLAKWELSKQTYGPEAPETYAWWPKNTNACYQYNQPCPYRKLCNEPPEQREVLLREGFFKKRKDREEGILKRALERRQGAAHTERGSEEDVR